LDVREGFHAGILMTVRGGLVVDEPHGERWDLALELLDAGEDSVSLGSLRLHRAARGPWADDRLHVDICSRYHRSQLTEQRARADIARGLRLLDVILADERFVHLVTHHGLVREYVDDYGTGAVRLAVIAPDGSPSWDAHPPTS
jgi:hypothetical protein